MKQDHYKAGVKTIIVSLVAGVGLIAMKAILGVIGRSQALIADAVHSCTDFATDILAYTGLKYKFKGADKNHPFGHGKIDTLMSMLIGVALIFAGIWMIYTSVVSLVAGDIDAPNYWALIGAVVSLVVKEWLYQYTVKVGRKIGSEAIIANAWHHRSDAVSSFAVIFGVLPGMLNPKLAFLDPVAAIVVALMISKFGLEIVIPSFASASDMAPDEETIDKIRAVSESVDGVINAHDIRARHYSNQIYAEIHIVVDPEITVHDGHEIAVNVRTKVNRELPDILDVIVHVDPENKTRFRR